MFKGLLTAILASGVVSGAVFFLMVRLGSRGQVGGGISGWAGATGIAAGFSVGSIVARGWPSVPPRDATEWLVFLGIAMVFLSRLGGGRPRSWLGWLGYVVGVGLLMGGLLPPAARLWERWSTAVVWAVGSGVIGIAALASWGALSPGFRDARWIAGYLTLLAGGSALVMSFSGSLLVAQLAGALAAAVAVQGILLTWIQRSVPTWASDVCPVVIVLVPGILLYGHWYASMHWGGLGFLAGGMFAPWAGRWRALGGGASRRGEWVAGTALGLCVLGALVTAYYSSPPLYY